MAAIGETDMVFGTGKERPLSGGCEATVTQKRGSNPPLSTNRRARNEASIRWLDTASGHEFDNALDRVISRHHGLSFFTDEQIAEIRAEMVSREWFRHRLNRQNRRRSHAA